MNPGTFATADMHRTQVCESGMSSPPGIPMSMAKVGDTGTIVSISGREETRKFLAGLGFTPGTTVKAVCEANGNVILDVKGSKIAIDRKMAAKILFCPER